MTANSKTEQRIMRHHRVRMKLSGTADKPRLCVFRSNGHIYGQLIDDVAGKTLIAASDVKTKSGKKGDKQDFAKIAAAKAVGLDLAKLALAKGIKQVVFDRGGYIYTGRVKALADGGREGGLEF